MIKPVLLALALAFSLDATAQHAYAPLSFPSGFSSAAPAPVLHSPALPFRYVGRLVQNGRSEVLLMRGGMLHSVGEGDEIDGEYRVERITGATIHFTYLPSRMKQNLDLTAANR